MSMTHQQGTVHVRGKKVKKWYGKFLIYTKDRDGKELRKHRHVSLGDKASMPKWKAEQLLREIILRENQGNVSAKTLPADDTVTFGWFLKERYIPMREGSWSPAYKKTNVYQLNHYLGDRFADKPLRHIDTFQIQIFLNELAAKDYSEAVVRSSFSNMRAIMHLAKKQKFIVEDPGEDVTMPQTKIAQKPVMAQAQLLGLIGALDDLHDLCLMCIGIFCGPRASEAFGLQWKSWTGESLVPHGTAYEGKFYAGRLKTKQSKAPIVVPAQVQPIIEAWKGIASDTSPDALMFPTFGRGKRKGQAVPRWGKNFLKWRIRPVAQKLGIPDNLVTFQVMRRTLGTDMQKHGTLKDTQGILRHASIRTTGDIYVQRIEQSVVDAINSRTAAVLEGWKANTEELTVQGRNPRGISPIRPSSAKPVKQLKPSC